MAVPATAYDAKGLLLESIFSEDPAIFVEGRSLFSMTDRGAGEALPHALRPGRRSGASGTDLTLVAIGNQVPLALRVASELAASSVDAEVIDLRTLSPWDKTTVLRVGGQERAG